MCRVWIRPEMCLRICDRSLPTLRGNTLDPFFTEARIPIHLTEVELHFHAVFRHNHVGVVAACDNLHVESPKFVRQRPDLRYHCLY